MVLLTKRSLSLFFFFFSKTIYLRPFRYFNLLLKANSSPHPFFFFFKQKIQKNSYTVYKAFPFLPWTALRDKYLIILEAWNTDLRPALAAASWNATLLTVHTFSVGSVSFQTPQNITHRGNCHNYLLFLHFFF